VFKIMVFLKMVHWTSIRGKNFSVTSTKIKTGDVLWRRGCCQTVKPKVGMLEVDLLMLEIHGDK
jgi:hypothetical protein